MCLEISVQLERIPSERKQWTLLTSLKWKLFQEEYGT